MLCTQLSYLEFRIVLLIVLPMQVALDKGVQPYNWTMWLDKGEHYYCDDLTQSLNFLM